MIEARQQFAAGYSVTEIARSLQRSRTSISAVVHGHTYQRVVDLPNTPPLRHHPSELEREEDEADANRVERKREERMNHVAKQVQQLQGRW